MKTLEYTIMAEFYDELYKNKDYKKEVSFIEHFINQKDCLILDAGCGTGTHASILNDLGYNVYGFDLNQEMVNIANKKIEKHFEVGNLLTYQTNSKFDLIISFFAVFNHLKNYKEFKLSLKNLKQHLNLNGKIIIDIHNPQKNGKKIDFSSNIKRIMRWKVYKFVNKEFSTLTYIVNNKKYKTHHTFSIFKINKIENICKKLGFADISFYENYNANKTASNKSKNIQIVLSL